MMAKRVSTPFNLYGFWFYQQKYPESPLYNMSESVRIRGYVDHERLENAINELATKHEILKSRFVLIDNELVTEFSSEARIEIQVLKLDQSYCVEDESFLESKRNIPFCLDQAPLLRASLFQFKSGESVFLVTFHHIITDGWSMELFWKYLSEIYSADSVVVKNKQHSMSTYADILKDGSYLEYQKKFSNQLDYWKEELSGNLGHLNIGMSQGLDHETLSRSYEKFVLEKETVNRLRQSSQELSCTLYVNLLSQLYVLLYQYSNKTDLLIGTVSAGRTFPGSEAMLGCFLNALALRFDLDPEMSFAELTKEVGRKVYLAHDHQNISMEEVLREVGSTFGKRRNFFEVMFLPLKKQGKNICFGQLTAEKMMLTPNELDVDLIIYFEEVQDTIVFWWDYNDQYYSKEMIKSMVKNYIHGIEVRSSQVNQKITVIDHLNSLQLQESFLCGAGDHRDLNPTIRLEEIFFQQALLTPNNIAIEHESESITYQSLNIRSEDLSKVLKGRGEFVGIYLERSIDFVVSILAVLKSGRAYLPLDKSLPPNRLKRILEDARVDCIITKNEDVLSFVENAGEYYIIDLKRIGEDHIDEEHLVVEEKSHLAYLMYTSGSTGMPKGVMIDHVAVVNRLQWMWREFPLQEGEVICQKTVVSFVDSVCEFLIGLLCGVKTVIVSDSSVQNPLAFLSILKEKRISRLTVIPSYLEVMLKVLKDAPQVYPNDLKVMTCSGEELHCETVVKWYRDFPEVPLLNIYGSTELCADATCFNTMGKDMRDYSSVPIGRPIDNCNVYLLNDHNNLIPKYCVGEIFVSGDCLAEGYLAPFIPEESPFKRIELNGVLTKVYRTGDFGRWLEDGSLEFHGRKDHLVKVRGQRVHLDEVRRCLASHDEIGDCAVILHEEERKESFLLAFFCSKQPLNNFLLRKYLKQYLPEYMIPSFFIKLEMIPTRKNGKIDIKALEQKVGDYHVGRTLTPPSTQAEIEIMAIWEQSLGHDKIGVEDTYLDVGGTSIDLLTVICQLEKKYNKSFQFKDFMDCSLADIARKCTV